MEEVGRTIEYLLTSDPPLVREAWIRMWGWYRDAANRPPSTPRVSLETLMAERAELYSRIMPQRQPLPIEVALFPVDDNILGEEVIYEAVLQLQLNCARGLYGMLDKQFRMWLRAAMREENPDPGNWEKVAAITQADFRRGELAASCSW